MEKDLKQYIGKRVTLVRNLPEPNAEGHSTVEQEGFVIEASDQVGVLFRQRGRTNGDLVRPSEIEDIRLFLASPKPVKVKELKKMNLETVRQHLSDRHGTSVSMLNSVTDEVAMKMHDEMHEAHGTDIGHRHGSPGATES